MEALAETTVAGYAVEYWISREAAADIEYADYWNDENAEADKDWNVVATGFDRLESYLAETGYADDIRACLRALPEPLGGRGIDLAAGCLWAVPVVLEQARIEQLYCLEFSAHRLLKLGPLVLQHYGIAPSAVRLVYGSFYDLKLADGSLDFALLASAFHHADDPARLLAEVRRILRRGGTVIITGEPRVTWLSEHLRYFARLLLPRVLPAAIMLRLFGRIPASVAWPPSRNNVFPVHPVLGDHLYTPGEYRKLFSAAGFACREIRGKLTRAFILTAI